MQLSEIRTAVRQLLGVNEADPYYSNTKVTAFINSVNRRQGARRPWPWMEVLTTFDTVSGQQAYDLPANHRTTLELTAPNRPLQPFQAKEHARYNAAQSAPQFFTIRNNDIYLMPIPSDVETISHRYIASPVELVNDADEPEIPDAFVDWLITETAIQFAVSVGDSERISALETIAAYWWDSIKDEVRQTRGSSRPTVRRDW